MSSFLALLIAQEDLQRNTYGHKFEQFTDEQRMEYIRWNVLALENELHEMLGETGWKPWASSNHINLEQYVGEGVDAFHFLMNLLLATGLKVDDLAEEFTRRYYQKRAVNAGRQKEGYDGISGKCPGCGRDIAETSLEEVMVDVPDAPTTFDTLCPCGTVLWNSPTPA